ncbi:MAG: FAD-dependent oxidoreductase [Alphaproteobacteria bacterium]|nr:FAD-dependent oxidoreductase [Alphaproteobacteria bacterium]
MTKKEGFCNSSFRFTFEDLLSPLKLRELDQVFCRHLMESDEGLAHRLELARDKDLPPLQESALILDLAPYVEDFLGEFFSIQREIAALQEQTYALAPLYRAKRLFVQRVAARAYSKDEALTFDGKALQAQLVHMMGEAYTDLAFANHVLKAMQLQDPESPSPCSRSQDDTKHIKNCHPEESRRDELRISFQDKDFLDLAKKYAAWAVHQPLPTILFRLPRKIIPNELLPVRQKYLSEEHALDQAHYCILCHNQEKDSCSKASHGCPLDQKISEMNTLRVQGHTLGALATIMIDNPMVAATGYRICNDCSKACIFQKQEAVNIPSIETQTLESILNLPWGVEIYSLLSRWNPLNFKHSYPKAPTGYKVLVAGMGPAGFTLAHYLMNEGHQVVGIDGLKIEPLPSELLSNPIRDWKDLKEPLGSRLPAGFGGVAEYGITDRWDKNFLLLVRLLLERRSLFSLYDNVRLGSTLTLPQAFEMGFDHVALCFGAGRPHTLDLPHSLARGVRVASDFLMNLQLAGAALEKSLSNLQIRLPVVVIGGGLTAVDTAVEALKYYPRQVEKFLKRTEEMGGLPPALSVEEQEIADEFIEHAKAFRRGDFSVLEGASKILYRKELQESPAFRLNPDEVDLALQEGIHFVENTSVEKIQIDEHGHIKSIKTQDKTYPCRTLLIATGTQANQGYEDDRVSIYGDLDPQYHGNVVKAMASAKNGYLQICEKLEQSTPQSLKIDLEELLTTHVVSVNRLTPSIIEILVKAPQATQNFKPGQFFRFQTYGPQSLEAIALTGASFDRQRGLLSLIILEMGGSSSLCQYLEKDEKVALMGPTGVPTEIPQGETVLLIGGGLGNAVLFSIGRALKDNNNHVIYVAGYKAPSDLFKGEEIEAVADQVIWCSESSPLIKTNRPQDVSIKGTVLDGLLKIAESSSKTIDRIITIGSDRMMAAVACAKKTILKPVLKKEHLAIGSINSPMQCMMKGVCGQCLQTLIDPQTGEKRVVFSCEAQDQNLEEVQFDDLHQRLKQNSLLEKQTGQWIKQKWKMV